MNVFENRARGRKVAGRLLDVSLSGSQGSGVVLMCMGLMGLSHTPILRCFLFFMSFGWSVIQFALASSPQHFCLSVYAPGLVAVSWEIRMKAVAKGRGSCSLGRA